MIKRLRTINQFYPD